MLYGGTYGRHLANTIERFVLVDQFVRETKSPQKIDDIRIRQERVDVANKRLCNNSIIMNPHQIEPTKASVTRVVFWMFEHPPP